MTCKVICHILQGGVDGPSGNDEHIDDDQFDLDMCYDEYQQESLDRHWAVMVKTFRSLDEVYTFYSKHARERGFSIRKDSLKFSKDRKDSALEEVSLFCRRKTTGQVLYHGRPDPQA